MDVQQKRSVTWADDISDAELEAAARRAEAMYMGDDVKRRRTEETTTTPTDETEEGEGSCDYVPTIGYSHEYPVPTLREEICQSQYRFFSRWHRQPTDEMEREWYEEDNKNFIKYSCYEQEMYDDVAEERKYLWRCHMYYNPPPNFDWKSFESHIDEIV